MFVQRTSQPRSPLRKSRAMETNDPVQLAMQIRQGRLRLAELPEALRPLVQAVLTRLTDGQAQTLACRAEQRRPYRIRSAFQRAVS